MTDMNVEWPEPSTEYVSQIVESADTHCAGCTCEDALQ